MGRRRKQENGSADPAPARTNGYDKDKVRSFTGRIETLLGDIEHEKSEFMNRCKEIHGDIKLTYQEAKDEAGIPKKELKAVIKARGLERKAAAVRDDLESEQADTFDRLRLALGDLADTPLGAAAMDSETRVRGGADATT